MSEDKLPLTTAPAAVTNRDSDANTSGGQSSAGSLAKIVYILYLIGLITGITSVVGVILAYINKAQAPAWVQSHYRFQIRTFWLGCLYSFIGALTSLIFIGWLILFCVAIWLIMRCIKGMQWAENGQPVENVETWFLP